LFSSHVKLDWVVVPIHNNHGGVSRGGFGPLVGIHKTHCRSGTPPADERSSPFLVSDLAVRPSSSLSSSSSSSSCPEFLLITPALQPHLHLHLHSHSPYALHDSLCYPPRSRSRTQSSHQPASKQLDIKSKKTTRVETHPRPAES
jgi:hypothetical protein